MIFEKWFDNQTKVISLQKCHWDKPHFAIYTNGAKKANGDFCYNFNILFWQFAFSYTDWDLQNKRNHKRKIVR